MKSYMVEITVIVAMLALNAVFAAYEMVLAAVSRARFLMLCEQKRRCAESALGMKSRLEASLAVVQLGITVAGAVVAHQGASVAEWLIPILQQRFASSDGTAEFVGLAMFVAAAEFCDHRACRTVPSKSKCPAFVVHDMSG